MAQKRKRRRAQSSGQRRAYDQSRDARRTQGGSRNSGSRTRSGYQEQTIELETARTAQRQSGRADNSIEFPSQQQRRRAAQGQNGTRRGGNARSAQNQRAGQRPQGNVQRYPTAEERKNASRGSPNAQRTGRMRPTAANMQNPARREKRKQHRITRAEMRRRRLARRLAAFLTLLCVIAAGIYLTVTMLFKINSITVQTADGTVVTEAGGYSSEQILQALGVQLEDNIFSFDPAEKAESLEKVFPLLEQIRVDRKYPTSVVVRVTEAVPAWAMQTESGWLTISETLKIITEGTEQPALPTLYGGEPVSCEAGEQLAFAADEESASSAAEAESEAASGASAAASTADEAKQNHLEALTTLLAALQNRGLLADVTRIEFEDTEQIAFVYQSRISVLLGTLNELDYKMDFAQYLLLNTDGKGCAATDTGELDCSHVRSDGTLRPIFAQGAPTLPSGYDITTQPVAAPVEETPSEEVPADGTADGAAPAEDETPTEGETPAEAAPAETAAPADGTAEQPAAPTEGGQ